MMLGTSFLPMKSEKYWPEVCYAAKDDLEFVVVVCCDLVFIRWAFRSLVSAALFGF